MKEEWRAVVGFDGIYSVSNRGSIRRDIGGQGARSGKILKPGSNPGGYCVVILNKYGDRYVRTVHRVVAEAFIGPCPDGLQRNHIDGDKTNNCAENLEYVTPSENMLHSYRTGLRKAVSVNSGESNGMSSLTNGQVVEIRVLLESLDLSQVEIAELYNVSGS